MNNIYEVSKCEYSLEKVDVSVICCFRNSEKFITECLLSILSQKSCNFELLMLDDFSEDDSLSIAKHILNDSKIKYKIFKSDKNIGVPKARNFLIKNSIGKLLAIHDSDDVMMPYRIAAQKQFFEKNNNITVLGGHAIKIDDCGNFIELMSYPPCLHDDIVIMLSGRTNPVIDPTVMMKKEDFCNCGMYSVLDNERLVQDFDMWMRMSCLGFKFSNLQFPLISYRVNKDGITQNKKVDMIKAHVLIQRKYSNFLRNIRTKNEK